MTIRTRFAPSPTGYLHVGGARTALFSWLYARKHGGRFVLRIEDTDLERSTAESVQAILDGMSWLGLDYDEGPFYQTQRFDRYKEIIQQLLEQGDAYHCYCSKDELEEMREQQRAKRFSLATGQRGLSFQCVEPQNGGVLYGFSASVHCAWRSCFTEIALACRCALHHCEYLADQCGYDGGKCR